MTKYPDMIDSLQRNGFTAAAHELNELVERCDALITALQATEGALQSILDGNKSPDLVALQAIVNMAQDVIADAQS